MNAKNVLHYYFVILFLEVVAEVIFLFTGNAYLLFTMKPLLMPTLIVWAFLFASENNIRLNPMLIVALVCSMFGDVSLMLLSLNPDIFIVGLICFLVAHIIYIQLFIKIPSRQKSILLRKPHLVLVLFLYGALLLWFLYQQNHPEFIKMQIPVIIYATVILAMLLAAISRYDQISSKSFKPLALGALLFVLSDSCIALSKFSHLFVQKEHIARTIIMALYGFAQFLIVKGYISSKIR